MLGCGADREVWWEGGREGRWAAGHRNSSSCTFIRGEGREISGLNSRRASLAVVWPSPDDFVELVTWGKCLLHIPVSFDLVFRAQGSQSHSTSQQTLGCPEGPGRW